MTQRRPRPVPENGGSISTTHILPARVLHEDDDFITMEVAKHDAVTFHLRQNEEGETVGGDQFHTLVFVKQANAPGGGLRLRSWLPWVKDSR